MKNDTTMDTKLRKWINIKVDTPISVCFESDAPSRIKEDSYNCKQHVFNVNDNEMLAISSKPLLRALAIHIPLGGKTFTITRTGSGYDTLYKVRVIE